MTVRYLFGPVDAPFVNRHLHAEVKAGRCMAFDHQGLTGVAAGPHDSWERLLAQLPPAWRPDFVVLYLCYQSVPSWLWSAPVPLIGWAADWNLNWHAYRLLLPSCEHVLTDQPGVAHLAKEGLTHATAFPIYAAPQGFLDGPWPEGERDIDVLFVGNLHPAVQRERSRWLGRLATLDDRWRIVIRTGVFGEDYRQLLGRAKVVFNRSIRGECNQRVFEATAAGALLLQDQGTETEGYFQPGQECVVFDEANLESVVEHFLAHDEERQRIAVAGRERVQSLAFETVWRQQVEALQVSLADLKARAQQRTIPSGFEALLARTWQVSASADRDPTLTEDLTLALSWEPGSADLHNALGVATACAVRHSDRVWAEVAAAALPHFEQAAQSDPTHVVAHLNLAQAWAAVEQPQRAVAAARQALTALERLTQLGPRQRLGCSFPPVFDLFRIEWERASWTQAGDSQAEETAKQTLLRWQLHRLLSDLTGHGPHFHEAVFARPDLAITRAALGCALARAGAVAEAVRHLQTAVQAHPFDSAAAQNLYQLWLSLGEPERARQLVRERRRLAQAAPDLLRAETWWGLPEAEQPPPSGLDLASILILCCNQADYTKLCLESVLRHTRPPYELIVVDNGSTDETPALLEHIKTQSGPERVEVLRNETNVGFPAGCNQAARAARGAFLVFLNNDTVVTPGWLEGLARWIVRGWPSVGMVGAVTNATRAPQQVEAGYHNLSGLEAFSEQRRRQFADQILNVQRLTGFCFLMRRELFERVGGFDERYGLGFFDDDDLSVQVLRAGYQLHVALDVFIHHFGSRTFAGLGVEATQLLQDNLARFRAKWGDAEAAGYKLRATEPQPTVVVPARLSDGRGGVSLCLIVKNEEANLADCLNTVKDLVDEVVVVDTGSTDTTRAIATSLGAKVVEFAWVDSFAAARNESLRHATGDWIFWMDADDRLDEANRLKLHTLFARLKDAPRDDNAAYVMKCLCLPDPKTKVSTVVDHVRLFRNRPDIRWEHRVHEQILGPAKRSGAEVRWSDVVITHVGYQDPALRRTKLERDLRLLQREQQEMPDHPFTLFNLGSVYLDLGQWAEGLTVLRRSLAQSAPTDSIVRKLYGLMAHAHLQQQQPQEALAVCRQGRKLYPDDAELLFREALVREQMDDAEGAIGCLDRLVHGQEKEHFASVAPGLRGHRGRHKLGELLWGQGRAGEAERQWRLALQEEPGFAPAWTSLGELWLKEQRWPDLEETTSRLRGLHEEFTADMLQARGLLAQQEFDAARTLLETVIAKVPQAVWPHEILSHVWLQEGKDWAAAERALQDVLALNPSHSQARHNLDVLLRGKPSKSSGD